MRVFLVGVEVEKIKIESNGKKVRWVNEAMLVLPCD